MVAASLRAQTRIAIPPIEMTVPIFQAVPTLIHSLAPFKGNNTAGSKTPTASNDVRTYESTGCDGTAVGGHVHGPQDKLGHNPRMHPASWSGSPWRSRISRNSRWKCPPRRGGKGKSRVFWQLLVSPSERLFPVVLLLSDQFVEDSATRRAGYTRKCQSPGNEVAAAVVALKAQSWEQFLSRRRRNGTALLRNPAGSRAESPCASRIDQSDR